MGVASGGDTVAIINRNFNFFNSHPCNVIVCASKSRGATLSRVKVLAGQLGAQLIIIATTKVPGSRRLQANAAIARQILQAV
jgi:hypothetical protein